MSPVTQKNTPYFFSIALIAITFYVLNNYLSLGTLGFLLKPTNFLIELITQTESSYIPEKGYYFSSLKIIIDKSCSGFNFGILCFILVSVLLIYKAENNTFKKTAIPLSIAVSYVTTLGVNTFRIHLSIIAQLQANTFLAERPHYLIHDIIGLSINTIFLLLIYFLINNLLNHTNYNGEIKQS